MDTNICDHEYRYEQTETTPVEFHVQQLPDGSWEADSTTAKSYDSDVTDGRIYCHLCGYEPNYDYVEWK